MRPHIALPSDLGAFDRCELLAGRFRLVGELGKGGYARVDEAVDIFTSQHVAVKRALSSSDADATWALLDEAKLLSRVAHENVVGVHGVYGTMDQPVLALELVRGASLKALAFGGGTVIRQDERTVRAIGLFAARGLGAIHDARGPRGEALGVVHRDVNPNNLLVTADGGLKVIDLGIASTNPSTPGGEGHGVGTLGYSTPEELDGGSAPDARADVFSLGVVLWELLAGRRLFRRTSFEESARLLRHCVVPSVLDLRQDVDARLARLVAAMLERDRERRPVSMLEVCTELESLERQDAVSAAETLRQFSAGRGRTQSATFAKVKVAADTTPLMSTRRRELRAPTVLASCRR